MKGIKEKKLIKKIAQKYSLELILLFGSRVSGKIHGESDYDIGYLSKRTLSLEEEGGLIMDIAGVLKTSIAKIGLVPLKNVSPLLLKEVFTNAQVIFAKDVTIFDRYKIYAFRYFEESRPLFEQTAKILGKRVEKYKKDLSIK